jgi:hypothetical protein
MLAIESYPPGVLGELGARHPYRLLFNCRGHPLSGGSHPLYLNPFGNRTRILKTIHTVLHKKVKRNREEEDEGRRAGGVGNEELGMRNEEFFAVSC